MSSWLIRGVMLPDEQFREIYVVNGRISAEPVRDATLLVDSGWILPGLVDAHGHLGMRIGGSSVHNLDEAAQLSIRDRDTGVLAIRDMGSPIDLRPLGESLPRVITSGRHLAAPGRYLPGIAVECDLARLPAGNEPWVKLIADWLDPNIGDLTPSWSAQALATAITSAHDRGARVAVHTYGTEAAEMAIRAGVDSIEHGTGLTDQLINQMRYGPVALIPTMLAVENFRLIAAIASHKHSRYAERLLTMHERFPEVVRSAYEAGVPIFVGTDAGSDIAHGRIVEEIMRLHRRAAIPAHDVVAAASWRAREWLGLPLLSPGAPADLVVYAADPRLDLAELGKPVRIMLHGEVIR